MRNSDTMSHFHAPICRARQISYYWRHHKTANIQIFFSSLPSEKKEREKKKKNRNTFFRIKRSGPSTSSNYVVGNGQFYDRFQLAGWWLKLGDRYLTCPPTDLFHLHHHFCAEEDGKRTAKLHPDSYMKDDDVRTSSSRLCQPSIL